MPKKGGTVGPFTGTYCPFIQTARFDIFHQHVVRNPAAGHPRELFTVWGRRYDDMPRPVCEVVLHPNPYGLWVEWIHVDEEHRRNGIATEVLRALRKKLGLLTITGATVVGENFVAAREKFINSRPDRAPTTTRKKKPAKKCRSTKKSKN